MNGLRVLVVDDCAVVADGFSRLLCRWGHQTRVAYDGSQALAVAPEFRPDVALLDVGLPRMGCYEVGRRLRELPGLGGLMLVALTGHADAAYERRAQAAGFAALFFKLAAPSALEALLRALAREKARRTLAP